VTDKEIQELKSKNVTEQKKIEEAERIKLINEKLKKLKDYKKDNENPMVLSVVRRKKDNPKENFTDDKKIAITDHTINSTIQDNHKTNTNISSKKKKDTIDPNFSQSIPSISYSDKMKSEKSGNSTMKDENLNTSNPRRSFFFCEEEEE
jgi:hypothetical protein